MTNGQDWGQPPQYPQKGYGQQYPQGQPRQYDPRRHQRRMQGPPPAYGQVQPYAPPPPYQGYPPCGQPPFVQPQYAPPVAPKSTAAGLILGLLWPGVGCMCAGRVGISILLMGLWLISIPLIFVFGIGFLTGFATWIASAALGYTMTREWNTAHGIVSLSAGQRQRSAPTSYLSLPLGILCNVPKNNQEAPRRRRSPTLSLPTAAPMHRAPRTEHPVLARTPDGSPNILR